MGTIRLNQAVKGLMLSVLYCASFLLAWRFSMDQWYLPAGLRAAGLLFLPYRYWPYLFAGDAAALLVLRGPKADLYSAQWAYLSPFLLTPMISVVPLVLRKLRKHIEEKERWLPLIGLSLAVWSALCTMALNLGLSGPAADNPLETLLRFSIGYYLGILMLVLPLLMWMRRNSGSSSPKHLGRDTAVAIGLIGVMYGAVVWPPAAEPAFRQAVLMLMIAPAVGLTFLHGWRGAALGIAVVSVAIRMALPNPNLPGAYDADAFVAQQALAIAATALFMLGSIISEHFDRARKLGLAEEHALRLAQTSFRSNERQLRERVVVLAQVQSCLDRYTQQLIQWLKDHGRYAVAMEVTGYGVTRGQLFDKQVEALYPIRIEQYGLFRMLLSEDLEEVWTRGIDVGYSLRGNANVRRLTLELQVVAYRCVCSAVAMLPAGDHPNRHRMKIRGWRRGDRQGLVMTVTARSAETQPLPAATLVALELEIEGRVKAHGGLFRRRHANKISLLLAEPVDAVDRR